MTVQAYDNGVPSKTANIFITVNVRKNVFSPEFINLPYSFSVSESTQPGSLIYSSKFSVNAPNPDA